MTVTASPPEAAIVARAVRKVYADGHAALHRITFDVGRDSILCVVGPNGAGKTTLMRILATQLRMSDGTMSVLGLDIDSQFRSIRARVAAVPQDGQPDLDLTPFEHVFYYLRARGMSKERATVRTERALKLMDLWLRRSDPARRLSGGMRRRILIAMCIGSDASVLLLDEPTTGLDPVSRRETWNVLAELSETRTIVMTTHMMEEAEALADGVLVLNEGRLVGMGTVTDLKATLPAREKIHISGAIDPEQLAPFGRVERCAGAYILYPSGRDAVNHVVGVCMGEGISISVLPTGLEDVYLTLINGPLQCNA
ncbi:MAG: ABC transporter ATP-binding protein [Vicinamibacterales bacterium]|jgi:ABC-2 type transport system ATP-binding protein